MNKFIMFIISMTLSLTSLEAMQVNRVILSTNDNINYIEFWPVVAPIWKAMGIQPTLAIIGDKPVDESLGDVVRFPTIPGVPTSLQAQTVRLLLPILYPNDVCIISDIDMLPVSKKYFTESAIKCPDNAFVIFRDRAYAPWGWKAYPMCYFAARGDTFKQVFGANTYDDINVIIKQWSELGYGWNTDETVLYSYVNAWGQNGGNLVKLGHDVIARFDRMYWDTRNLDITKYIDSHMPRPYSGYKESIDFVVSEIMKNLNR